MKETYIALGIMFWLFGVSFEDPFDWRAASLDSGAAVIRQNNLQKKEVVGEISDSHCRFTHMEDAKSAEDCVFQCLKHGARLVLADREGKIVYALDAEGQKQARNFAGRRAKVSGHVMEGMIHVERIEAAY